jgi:hypothetical protein
MSELIEHIMKKYDVDFEEALEIIERQDKVMSIIFNTFEPYGKHRH